MPRKIDPAKIKVGHGLAASDSVEVNAMIPSGAGSAPAGLTTHVQDDHNAHPAHAVSIDNVPDTYDAKHVEGALDELSALVPPRPSFIGLDRDYLDINTIPDWGILKLDDGSINKRFQNVNLDWDNDTQENGKEVYPYFWTPLGFLKSNYTWMMDDDGTFGVSREYHSSWNGYEHRGEKINDHQNNDKSDPIFNVWDPSYAGGGPGNAHAGHYARDIDGDGVYHVEDSATVIPSSGPAGGLEVVISGTVYPADRGTLALIRFCPGGDLEEICHDGDLLKRCIAAINLGQGILDKCDGDPGGIFTLGEPGGDEAPASFDPYSFPGRATGQYNLDELHRGVAHTGDALPAPFDDGDQDGTPGWNYAGQVRLGTDPNAGMAVVPDGVPILGGSSIARGGGHDENFFAYRLPYMDNYGMESGLKYTPEAERVRYKRKPVISLDPTINLETYGGYTAFPKEYWTWQIARYRHQFKLTQDILLDGQLRDSGSYLLVHFKKEEYFEAAVRDGIWNDEWVYSAYPSQMPDVEDEIHRGYRGLDGPYHTLRSNVVEDPNGSTKPNLTKFKVTPGHWLNNQVEFMYISGVAYVQPSFLDPAPGSAAFDYPNVSFYLHVDFELGPDPADPTSIGFWDHTWRSAEHELALGINNEEEPDQDETNNILDNENPLFFDFGQYVNWGDWKRSDLNQLYAKPDGSYYRIRNGLIPDGTFFDEYGTQNGKLRRGRLELSSNDLRQGAGLPADEVPLSDKNAAAAGYVWVSGATQKNDFLLSKFSADAKLRAFLRRPLSHISDVAGATPSKAELDESVNFVYEPNMPKVLWHGSTQWKFGADNPIYGNVVDSGGNPIPSLTAVDEKKRQERFLDEVFRIRSDFKKIDGADLFSPTDFDQLNGPGLPHGATPIKLPVALTQGLPATSGGEKFDHLFWLSSQSYQMDLTGVKELQVAGLPDRSPKVTEGRTSQTPFNGILLYPQKNYGNSAWSGDPDDGTTWADGDYYPPTAMTTTRWPNLPQPDYSTVGGVRQFTRLFHIEGGEGRSQVKFTFKGIQLEHFRRSPGATGNIDFMAIEVKVPGLTTWMDLGRKDGSGPSKQDPFKDGAGCLVVGADTQDYESEADKLHGIVSCSAKAHLGPAANLFEAFNGEVPLLVRVTYYNTPLVKDLNFEQGGPYGPSADLRGLIQIDVDLID